MEKHEKRVDQNGRIEMKHASVVIREINGSTNKLKQIKPPSSSNPSANTNLKTDARDTDILGCVGQSQPANCAIEPR